MRERWLFLEAVGGAISVEVDLRIRPFTTVLARLHAAPETPSRAAAGGPPITPVVIRRAIRRAYRVVPFSSTCLKESLIFCRMARRRGYSAQLRIGVQKADDLLRAHAWVEDGRGAVLTDPLEQFLPMPLPGQKGVG
jgi:hypothetical protein